MDRAAECYRRYLAGEENAFDEIMKELFGKLIFFVNRYVGDLNAAEDIAIDTFADLSFQGFLKDLSFYDRAKPRPGLSKTPQADPF